MIEDKREFTGVWMPKEVLDNQELTFFQKVLYCDIASFGRCFMLNKTFAERYGVSETSISKNISQLVKLGLVQINAFDGRKRFMTALHVSSMQGLTNLQGRVEANFKAGLNETSNIDNNIDNNLDNNLDNIADLKNPRVEEDVFIDLSKDKTSVEVAKPKARKQDPIWDALITCLKIDQSKITASSRGALNKVVKELKDVGATPEEIYQKVHILRASWPTLKPTATSLIKRWPELTPESLDLIVGQKARDKELDRFREAQNNERRKQEQFDQLLAEGVIDEEGNFIKRKEIEQ